MTSFLLISKSKQQRKQYIQEFCQKHDINQFDITLIQKNEDSKNLTSLGIEDVKNMQKKLFLKPLNSPQKAVILDDAELLTIEAQNALLKVLEEPPAHTLILLSAETQETFLPTILSRCQIIKLEEDQPQISSTDKKDMEQFFTELPNLRVGDILKKAELLSKNKQDTMQWLENIILAARQKLLEAPNPKRAQRYAIIIKQFQSLHTQLKTTNINPRFALEVSLLSINNP